MLYFKRILYILIIFLCIFSIVYYTIEKYLNIPIKINKTINFTIPIGIGSKKLESLLLKDNIIDRDNKFRWILIIKPWLIKFKAGTYQLIPGMSLYDILNIFFIGKEVKFSVLFIEGSRFENWKTILKNTPYLIHNIEYLSNKELMSKIGLPSSISLEGMFYPDTYYYTKQDSDLNILKRAHQKMMCFLKYEWQQKKSYVPYKTPYEMLIMASIIEKETNINTERTKIASVLVNRLNKKMRLQVDPTVIYGLGKKYRGILYRSDLDKLTPFNTYLLYGLPPSPISMPSKASLRAAAHPDDTNYFYFVATGKGGHTFSTNFYDHKKAIKYYHQKKDKN